MAGLSVSDDWSLDRVLHDKCGITIFLKETTKSMVADNIMHEILWWFRAV